MRIKFLTLCLLAGASGARAWAAPRYPVAPFPGLACMSLKVTNQQAMDPSFVVPVYQQPSGNSPAVGRASAIVFARKPEVVKNGFVAAVLFNGTSGWVSANTVGPWHTMDGSPRRCVPSRMSDGSIGFDIK